MTCAVGAYAPDVDLLALGSVYGSDSTIADTLADAQASALLDVRNHSKFFYKKIHKIKNTVKNLTKK